MSNKPVCNIYCDCGRPTGETSATRKSYKRICPRCRELEADAHLNHKYLDELDRKRQVRRAAEAKYLEHTYRIII